VADKPDHALVDTVEVTEVDGKVLLRTELAGLQSRIDCLQQTRDALRRYRDTATHDANS
jgi:hypothetical protein